MRRSSCLFSAGILVAFLVAAVPEVVADDTSVTETVFVPPLFYVGDQVEVRAPEEHRPLPRP